MISRIEIQPRYWVTAGDAFSTRSQSCREK